MTKIELREEINLALSRIEDPEETVKGRIFGLENGIRLTKIYLEKYKKPYDYNFMGSKIKFSEPMIAALEDIRKLLYDKQGV